MCAQSSGLGVDVQQISHREGGARGGGGGGGGEGLFAIQNVEVGRVCVAFIFKTNASYFQSKRVTPSVLHYVNLTR